MGGGPWPPPMLWFRLSKKWLAPLFRGFHSSLAPTARPGSYAGKPLLRKAFCGFAVHAAKSDESLKGLRSSIRQRFLDKLGFAGPLGPQNAAAPPSAGFSANAKKATQRPGPPIYGAWPMKRCQEGAGQWPHPSGKAAAHTLRAAAASSAPPRATVP